MPRPSILEAIEHKRQPPEKPASTPRPTPRKPAAPASISREGKINVSAYFPPSVKSSLRLVQAKRGGKVQDLLAEALNLLFAKYNVPETAPLERPET